MVKRPVVLAEIVPVVTIDPTGHRHHDVLGGCLDMFCSGCDSETERAWLAHVVATQLLYCRCREGRLIRQAVRAGLGVTLSGGCPLILIDGPGVWQTAGERRRDIFPSRGPHTRNPNYGGIKKPAHVKSTFHIQVSVDVVLTLAGLGKLLQFVNPYYARKC